jgi:hypothetical protein
MTTKKYYIEKIQELYDETDITGYGVPYYQITWKILFKILLLIVSLMLEFKLDDEV